MRPRRCGWLGTSAIAIGIGIMVSVIFPQGALLFLVAALLIICGIMCCKRRR